MKRKVIHSAPPVLLAHLLTEENERNAALRERYNAALQELPKGRVYLRRVKLKNGKTASYAYLSRRKPGTKRPESKYIGLAESDNVVAIKRQIDDRDRLLQQLDVLEIERRMIKRALCEYQRLR